MSTKLQPQLRISNLGQSVIPGLENLQFKVNVDCIGGSRPVWAKDLVSKKRTKIKLRRANRKQNSWDHLVANTL